MLRQRLMKIAHPVLCSAKKTNKFHRHITKPHANDSGVVHDITFTFKELFQFVVLDDHRLLMTEYHP